MPALQVPSEFSYQILKTIARANPPDAIRQLSAAPHLDIGPIASKNKIDVIIYADPQDNHAKNFSGQIRITHRDAAPYRAVASTPATWQQDRKAGDPHDQLVIDVTPGSQPFLLTHQSQPGTIEIHGIIYHAR